MDKQPLVSVQKVLADLHISKTSFYAFVAKNKISVVKQAGNLSYITETDAGVVADYYKKKATTWEKQTKLADLKASNTDLRKQTETLQYQIKEYAERFIDMKQRAEELKEDKEKFANKRDEARQKIDVLSSKNSKLSVMSAIFGILLLVCLVAICLFFLLR